MVTIQINERTKAGKAILEVVKLFSDKDKGVKIIETTSKNKNHPISKNIPNAETLKAFRENDKKEKKGLKKFDSVDALFEDLGI